jgi:hypothetical protein
MANTRAYSVDPRLATTIVRRTADLMQTLRVLQHKLRYEKPGETGTRPVHSNFPPSMRHLTQVKVTTDPDQIIELINEARGELELIAESYGHLFGHNV